VQLLNTSILTLFFRKEINVTQYAGRSSRKPVAQRRLAMTSADDASLPETNAAAVGEAESDNHTIR
jgi:hypothetical protein